MFFFYFFFEQDAIEIIRKSLEDEETLDAGKIKDNYAYDYLLPKGCKKLELPENTAIEVKKHLAPGLFSILVSDAEKAYKEGKIKHFLVLYEEGKLYLDWIPKEIRRYITFWSRKELENIAPVETYGEYVGEEWTIIRSLRLSNLRNEIHQGQNTLFVGAGLSSSLGVPGWGELLKRLNSQVRKAVPDFPGYKSIKNDSNSSYLINARYLKETAERNKISFVSEIRKKLYRKISLSSDLMDAVIEMLRLNRIGEIITYNYDTLLEQRMTQDEIMNSSIDGQNRKVRNTIPVMHVHGLIDPKDTGFDSNVVLSEDDYHRLYSDSYHWANVAQLWALTHTTCIFVGLSMKDPSLRRLLDIAYKQGSQDVEHYAFLIRTEFKCHKEAEEVFSQMGVNIIWCEDRDDVAKQIMRAV